MWQRWNGTSHVFEKSDDNGSSWAPLPLNANTINEGTLAVARLPGTVAILNASNIFTGEVNTFGNGSATGLVSIKCGTGGFGSGLRIVNAIDANYWGILAASSQLYFGYNGGEYFRFSSVGVITSTSNGPHNFTGSSSGGVAIYLTNTMDSTGSYATHRVSSVSTNCYVSAFGPNYSAGGGTTYDLPGSICLYGDGAGGISFVTALGGTYIRFYIGGSSQAYIKHYMDYNGGMYPRTDNSGYIGYTGNRYGLVRAVTITPGDLTFDNGWTVTEAEKLGLGAGLAFLDADENLVALVGPQGFKDITALTYAKTTKKQRSLMPVIDHPSLLDPRKLEVNG